MRFLAYPWYNRGLRNVGVINRVSSSGGTRAEGSPELDSSQGVQENRNTPRTWTINVRYMPNYKKKQGNGHLNPDFDQSINKLRLRKIKISRAKARYVHKSTASEEIQA